MNKIIGILLLICIVNANVQKSFDNFNKVLKVYEILPQQLNYYCRRQITDRKIAYGVIGVLFAPIIAPMFAAGGLYGAAAVSNGLATMGGGAGMFGGTIVSGISGAILSTTAASSCDKPKSTYDSIISDKNNLIFRGEFNCEENYCQAINGEYTYNEKKYNIHNSKLVTN